MFEVLGDLLYPCLSKQGASNEHHNISYNGDLEDDESVFYITFNISVFGTCHFKG